MLPVSEPSLHLSSWLATICRSASSSRVRRSNCSSWRCANTQWSHLSSHCLIYLCDICFKCTHAYSLQSSASAGFTRVLEKMHYVPEWWQKVSFMISLEVSPSNLHYAMLHDVTSIDKTKQSKLALPNVSLTVMNTHDPKWISLRWLS